ncbi:DUF3732 domain-containing protein [Xanthocytophaga flava]|uniref:DUF3732 domain-containing protein n=1 Tax=Xanthocytophaga flava TaxID=3048013 RepID=UPI0028D197E6|nr:DUF3732 domain-containing protein [Xanthocytophaga flavus]MDJ1473718.1 DUF3732 domain-containing protein [Xanthocytophaga flavus]
MGAGKCAIPVDIVREASSWFGVIIETPSGLKLLARRDPGDQKGTGDMFVLEGETINVPDIIESKNTNVDSVKSMLDELAGLTMLDFDIDQTNSGFKGRPSFRDFAAFTFQPQNIVANPDVFFFKADTYEHREKLRSIFPYVINAVSPQLLAKQHELSQLQKTLKRKENEFNAINQVSERWLAEINSKVSQAKEYGLIQKPTEGMLREELLDILRGIVNQSTIEIKITEESIRGIIEEVIKLQKEESDISLELSAARKRSLEMSELQASTIQYRGALHVQRDRLKISEWLFQKDHSDNNCPICGNEMNREITHIHSLHESLKNIEAVTKDFSSMPAAFDREFERIRNDISKLTDRLKGVRSRRDALERNSEDARKKQYDSLSIARFIGALEQSLTTVKDIGVDSELQKELSELRKNISDLEIEISVGNIEQRKRRALTKINLNSGKLLPGLDVQRPNDPISLLIDDLTIKVIGTNREDYLWELGSGSNHLSYHIAVTLGLHQFFLELESSPIPSFIVYDQPSQVYFPQHIQGQEQKQELNDADLAAVRKIFLTLAEVIRKAEGKMQIIVLEHAGKDVWGDISEINLVADWHNEDRLIPKEWYSTVGE